MLVTRLLQARAAASPENRDLPCMCVNQQAQVPHSTLVGPTTKVLPCLVCLLSASVMRTAFGIRQPLE